MNDEQLIAAFHALWDAFPGAARLINRKHEILAANRAAQDKGFLPGLICAKVGTPESHKNCLFAKTLRTKQGQYNLSGEHLLRGWLPVSGRDDVVVHFSLLLPPPLEESEA